MKFILNNGTEQHSFEIQQGVTIIGRSSAADVCLQSSRVSRSHVECFRENDIIRIRDLGSSNGTYVNGRKIVEPATLQEGDRVSIGDIELRFSAEDGAGADAHFSGAGAPFVGAAAGAAGQEYSEEEGTPPDGTYMPEVYRPEGPPQSLITQRDGRWYLRDPRTNREVEIVPKGVESPDERRNRKLMMYGLIGTAALIAVILIAPSLMGNNTNVGAVPQYAMDKHAYDAALDEAVKNFDDGDLAAAKRLLANAHKERPDLKVAGILSNAMGTLIKAGENYADLDHEKAGSYLGEARRLLSTPTVRAWATSKIDLVEQIERIRMKVARALELKQAGKLEEAYAEMNSIPLQSPLRAAYQEDIRSLQDEVRLGLLARGDRALQMRDWPAARTFYEQAIKYAPSANHENELQARINDCERGAADKNVLEDARAHFEAKEYVDALELAQQISAAGFYADEARALAARVKDARDRDHVLALYRSGHLDEVIKYIRVNNLQQSMGWLERQASGLLEALKEARRLDEQGARISLVIAAYTKLTELEKDEQNEIQRLARERLAELLQDTQRRAQEFVQLGKEAYDRGDIPTARSIWERALGVDGRSGSTELQRLDDMARKLYLDGMAEAARGNVTDAKGLYSKAMLYAKHGSDYYTRAWRELENLK